MPSLQTPALSFQHSFLAAMAEFRAEGRGGQEDDSMVGTDLRKYGDTWTSPTVFAEYLTTVLAEADREVVPVVTLWWVDGDEYLGRISIRPQDSDWVLGYGGHFGYDIRPSQRRKGHATAMLRAGLEVAKGHGLQRALINCLPDNLASRAVIEAVGGIAEGEHNGILRHRVDL